MKLFLHGTLNGGKTNEHRSSPGRYRRWIFLSALILLVMGAPAIAIDPNLIVAFNGMPTTGTAPFNVAFTDNSTGGPAGWAWFFGDEKYTGPWLQRTATAPWSARENPSVVVLPDGSIVLMGGSFTTSDVWRSTNRGMNWTQVNATPGWPSRLGQNGVALRDGTIVLLGGYGGTYRNDVWVSVDMGATWILQNASPGWAGRFNPASVVLQDGSIVIMGGQDSNNHYVNDTWISADAGATWTQAAAAAEWSAREGFAAVVLPDNSIVLMGGLDDTSTRRNDVWRSVDSGATWTLVNASAGWQQRAYLSSVAMPDGSIVLMGGNGPEGPWVNDMWRSLDKGATWALVNASVGPQRLRFGSVVLPDGSIVIMGGSDGVTSYNDVWRLQPAGAVGANPMHTYTAAGKYTVTLQAYNADIFNRTQRTGYITVYARPAVTNISPKSGPVTGNTIVTITGTAFTGATSVMFGTTKNTTPFAVVSVSKITVRSPAHSAGVTDITVTTPRGTSTKSLADRFTYAAKPNVTGITPKSGPLNGNTLVTINGAGFTGATAVRFGTTKNTSPFTVVSASKITVRSPAHTAGATHVTVSTPGGTSATTMADRFTYAAKPNVTGIAPTSGPTTGDTLVTITGTGFTGATAVWFGTTKNITPLTVVSASRITVRSPAHGAGATHVTITTPGGTSVTSPADRFIYLVQALAVLRTGR